MLHEIKISEDFADAVINGEKNFEVRLNDRGYQKGDLVEFKVVPRSSSPFEYEIIHGLNEKTYEITYVLSGFGIKEGWVVFGFKER